VSANLDLDELRALASRGDARDRAFVDANLRMAWARTVDSRARASIGEVHEAVRSSARQAHEALRAEIVAGEMRGDALRRRFESVAALERDHFVEEVLGVAYPPFEERVLEPELIAYTPSGYEEIVHALDVTQLGPEDRFFDVGAGAGKVVLLATLLTGARSGGVERDAALVEMARSACRELGLERTRVEHGDARDLAGVEADVVFMYLPFTGKALETVLVRLSNTRPGWLCAGALDTSRHPELVEQCAARSWLHVYRWRAA
jgi:protein-L-isoaspartate O-methyltransferase